MKRIEFIWNTCGRDVDIRATAVCDLIPECESCAFHDRCRKSETKEQVMTLYADIVKWADEEVDAESEPSLGPCVKPKARRLKNPAQLSMLLGD